MAKRRNPQDDSQMATLPPSTSRLDDDGRVQLSLRTQRYCPTTADSCSGGTTCAFTNGRPAASRQRCFVRWFPNVLLAMMLIPVCVLNAENVFIESGPTDGIDWSSPRFANDSQLAVRVQQTIEAERAAFSSRSKRQWPAFAQMPPQLLGGMPAAMAAAGYCPADCAQCNYNQCRAYPYPVRCVPAMTNCCCPPVTQVKYDLKDVCDGEEAIAGCINGLCGQGFYCTRRRFCCRCETGKSLGNCVNGACPAGYFCNGNDYCCENGGAASVALNCVNGKCPVGYTCGADNICHANNAPFTATNAVGFMAPNLVKCINGRCPVGFSCGPGNLCYMAQSFSCVAPPPPFGVASPYLFDGRPPVFGRCQPGGLCAVGYTCGTDDFCHLNTLPICRATAGPPVLGRCSGGLCPAGYDCDGDDFCHKRVAVPPAPRNVSPRRKKVVAVSSEDESRADSSDESLAALLAEEKYERRTRRRQQRAKPLSESSSVETSRTKRRHHGKTHSKSGSNHRRTTDNKSKRHRSVDNDDDRTDENVDLVAMRRRRVMAPADEDYGAKSGGRAWIYDSPPSLPPLDDDAALNSIIPMAGHSVASLLPQSYHADQPWNATGASNTTTRTSWRREYGIAADGKSDERVGEPATVDERRVASGAMIFNDAIGTNTIYSSSSNSNNIKNGS